MILYTDHPRAVARFGAPLDNACYGQMLAEAKARERVGAEEERRARREASVAAWWALHPVCEPHTRTRFSERVSMVTFHVDVLSDEVYGHSEIRVVTAGHVEAPVRARTRPVPTPVGFQPPAQTAADPALCLRDATKRRTDRTKPAPVPATVPASPAPAPAFAPAPAQVAADPAYATIMYLRALAKVYMEDLACNANIRRFREAAQAHVAAAEERASAV